MKELNIKLEKIIKDETEETQKKTLEILRDVGKKTADELKVTSPQKTGKYASGWESVETPTGAKVQNKEHGSLTHLLEFGHQIVRKGKTVGRANAHPHIKPVENKALKIIMEKLKNI